MILTIRTDKPEAEIALFSDGKQLAAKSWQAHRQLAETIHQTIQTLLDSQQKSWPALSGVVVYQGPGSFTGLRIGMSVANALASGLSIPVIAASGDDWQAKAMQVLREGGGASYVVPEYGQPAQTTSPRR